MLEAKRAAGRSLAVRHMEDAAGRLGIGPEEVAVEVNGDGFRGPALDPAHRHTASSCSATPAPSAARIGALSLRAGAWSASCASADSPSRS